MIEIQKTSTMMAIIYKSCGLCVNNSMFKLNLAVLTCIEFKISNLLSYFAPGATYDQTDTDEDILDEDDVVYEFEEHDFPIRPNRKHDDGVGIDAIGRLKNKCLILKGSAFTIPNFHFLWERTLSLLYDNESDRPAVYWIVGWGSSISLNDIKFDDGFDLSVFPNKIFEKQIPVKEAIEIVLDFLRKTYSHADADIQSIVNDLEKYNKMHSESTSSNPIPAFPAVRVRLGIAGGMGPLAGANFAVDLFSLIQDESFIGWQFYMFSHPGVERLKTEKTIEAFSAAKALLSFIHSGLFQITCVPSNTAHLVWTMVRQPKSMVSVFQSVAINLNSTYQHKNLKVGFMTTATTRKYFNRGYGIALKEKNISFILLDDAMQKRCEAGILSIKRAGQITKSGTQNAPDLFMECVRWLHQKGANVIVMACTEIPLGLNARDIRSFPGLFLVDSSHCLALSVYDEIHKNKITDRSDMKV